MSKIRKLSAKLLHLFMIVAIIWQSLVPSALALQQVSDRDRQHPNVSLLNQLDPSNLSASADLFAKNFIWHFFNPKLPEIEGNYIGLEGLESFFAKLASVSDGSFEVEPIEAIPFGDELVVVHAKDRLTLAGKEIETDAVVVWRIVNGSIVEAWDIPSVYY